MKKINLNIVLVLIIIGIGLLAYSSYLAGYKASENNMDSLLMTMSIDSNFVTTGLYEELPDNIRKTMQFYIEDTPTLVNDVKIYAAVKYATIGNEVIDIKDGKVWNIIKHQRVFQRKFKNEDKTDNKKDIPKSSFANNLEIESKKNIL